MNRFSMLLAPFNERAIAPAVDAEPFMIESFIEAFDKK